jgi:hypothetical protein
MTEFEIFFFMKVVDMDVTFQMKLTCLNWSDKTLNMKEKLKTGQNPGISRTNF